VRVGFVEKCDCHLLRIRRKLTSTTFDGTKYLKMPKQVQDIKQFLEICRRSDAKCIPCLRRVLILQLPESKNRTPSSRHQSRQSSKYDAADSCILLPLMIRIKPIRSDRVFHLVRPTRNFADFLALKIEEAGVAKKKSKK
jgi:hypothetical protein